MITNTDTDETFTCDECGKELPIRPSAITGVTDDGTRRHLCIDCWSNGGTTMGVYRGP